MNPFTAFEFAFRLTFTNQEPAAYVWAVLAFIVSFFLIGLFWGVLWNRKWGIFGHIPSALLNCFFGLFFGGIVLAWFGARNTGTWLESQRDEVARQLTSLGSLNRDIFRSAWNKLQPLGGQKELTPPSDGGDELRLSSEEEAYVLAKEAASAVKRPLLTRGPFAFGVECYVHDPSVVADEVVKTITPPNYPIIVSSVNEWTKSAIKNQVGVAMDSAGKALRQPMEDLRISIMWIGLVMALLQVFVTALTAFRDIKENPQG